MSLGQRHVWKGTGSKRRIVVHKDEFMYIPVLQTLQNMLRSDEVMAEV